MSVRLACMLASCLFVGCSAIPDITHQPQFHNPFPQLHKIAILPFYNQSADPHVNQDELALAYYTELQQIPGFEVMPVGAVRRQMEAVQFEPRSAEDFQKFAQLLGVDAVIVGSVTEYTPYYPPRLGLSVNWYAANPGYHKIPVGYGLPWGTSQEEYIPNHLVQQAEFELAREQLKTQTPEVPVEFRTNPIRAPGNSGNPADRNGGENSNGAGPTSRRFTGQQVASNKDANAPHLLPVPAKNGDAPPELLAEPMPLANAPTKSGMPEDWPDPRGFVPPAPCAQKPEFRPHYGPIITHTRLYDGHDSDFTQALANYYYFRDDERFGGWQGYLHRTADFVRFCCYMHITETLSARGGAGESRVVYRWPIGRYER